MPFRKLFLNRWAALLWAGGILWTAVDTVGFGPSAKPAVAGNSAAVGAGDAGDAAGNATDATGMTVGDSDLATLANAMKGN